MGWVVSTTPRPPFLQERPGTHSTGGWVGLGAGLDRCGKSRPHRDFFWFSVLFLYFFFLIVLALPFVFYFTTHTTQTSMSPAGFEPAIPTSERLQNHALDRTATGIRSPALPGRSESLYRLPSFVFIKLHKEKTLKSRYCVFIQCLYSVHSDSETSLVKMDAP